MIKIYPPLPSDRDQNEDSAPKEKCGICRKNLRNSKVLPCCHCFCQDCLREYIASRHFDIERHFPCPICRADTDIPPSGVDGFRNEVAPDASLDPTPPKDNVIRVHKQPVVKAQDFRYGADLCFGRHGNKVVDFHTPIGLCIEASYIIVGDQKDSRILVFRGNGQLRSIFTLQGVVQSLTGAGDGSIFVLVRDDNADAVLKCSLDGAIERRFARTFTAATAHALALNQRNELLLTSLEQHNVTVLSSVDGRLLRRLGVKGRGAGRFLSPRNVAVDLDDRMYVCDADAHVVQVFSAAGKHIRSFGLRGSRRGQLLHPLGLVLDRHGNALVCDSGNRRIQLFDPSGRARVDVVDFRSVEPGRKDARPVAVALGADGARLVVLVKGLQFVQVRVYRYENEAYHADGCFCF